MSKIQFYPTFNELYYDLSNVKIDSKFTLEYIDFNDKIVRSISAKTHKDKTILKDSNNKWSPVVNNLIIRKKITMNTKHLFGKNGIAPMGSILGVATSYSSSKSLTRGVINNFYFSSDDEQVEFYIEYKFIENELRSDFIFESFIYLMDQANEVLAGEENLNNTIGVKLGTLLTHTFILTGDSSEFPTKIVSQPGSPLWWIDSGYHLDDVLQDAVMLYVNKSHKDYDKYDYRNKDKYNPDLIVEMYTSIVFQLINRHKDEYQDVNADDFSHNTLGEYIKFFVDAFSLDLTNPDKMYFEISRRFRKWM